MKRELVEKIVAKYNEGTFRIVDEFNKVIYKRLFYSPKYRGVFEFIKYKRNWGNAVPMNEIESWKDISFYQVSDVVKVKNFTLKVANYLEKSGLWPNIKEDFLTFAMQDKEYIQEYIDADFYEKKKILERRNITSLYCDDIVRSAKKGVVSINYNAYDKDEIRQQFHEAIKNHKEYIHRWRKGYDNTIECKDINGVMSAWYSAEFKNCGNGHYYIAIDERHAMFIEDD